MNTGQSLFSIGALFILSLTVLRVNGDIQLTDTVMNESKFGILGISLATSLIEEASKKAFDAQTADDAVSDVSMLTSPAGLGPGTGETWENFNDFDDYDDYQVSYDSLPSANFDLFCEVFYVEGNSPDQKVNYQTWHKKLIVTVTSDYMDDTLRLSTVYSYWHFR